MKQKILIIDDEIMLTDLLAQHFRDSGYLIYIANNAGEAIAQLGEKTDILLCNRIRNF